MGWSKTISKNGTIDKLVFLVMFKTIRNLIKPEKITFISKKKEAQNAYTFMFEKPKRKYRAGQHFLFFLKHKNPDNRKSFRIFSVSSAPHEQHLSFTTRYFEEKSSSFKKALMNLNPGETIKIFGPSPVMDVYKIDNFDKPYIFITGGIGITPFHAIIKDAVANKSPLKGVLLYANKDEDIIFKDELDDLAKQLEGFTIQHVLSPDRITAKTINTAIQQFSETPEIKLSGKVEIVDYYEDVIKKETSIPRGNIKAYKYKGLFGGY